MLTEMVFVTWLATVNALAYALLADRLRAAPVKNSPLGYRLRGHLLGAWYHQRLDARAHALPLHYPRRLA